MEEPRIKGEVLREFLNWYAGQRGLERHRRIVEQAPADLRDQLDPGQPTLRLLSSAWYPSRLVHSILDTISEGETEESLTSMAHQGSRVLVAGGFGSVYQALLSKLVAPETYALAVPRFWRQLHSTGERRVTIEQPGLAVSAVSDWAGHHPLLCTITIETMCSIFETMGCQEVRWHRESCVARGGRDCRTRVTWR